MVTRLSLEVHIYFTGGTYTKSCLLPKFQPVQSAPRGLLGWDTVCYTTLQALFLLRASRERSFATLVVVLLSVLLPYQPFMCGWHAALPEPNSGQHLGNRCSFGLLYFF